MKQILTKLVSVIFMSKANKNKGNCEKPKSKRNFILKLIDDDNNFSTANFFLVAMTFVGIIMLIVPVIGLCVDIFYNHTITVNMSDMGSYILAVSGIFGVAGLSNAWVEYSWNKYNKNIFEKDQTTTYVDNGCTNSYNNYENEL